MSPDIKKRFDNVLASSTFSHIADALQLQDKRMLDLGCGYGEYMQRSGPSSVGITTTPAEVTFGNEQNIDIRLGNAESLRNTISPEEHFDVFWANNLFEHLLSPHSFLVHLKEFAADDALLVLGVPVVPYPEALMKIKKFRGALATPHINFFTKKTLSLTTQFAGWDIQYVRPFIFSNALLDTAVSRQAPHLYVVARNNPNYTYPKKKMNEWENDEAFTDLIRIMHARKS